MNKLRALLIKTPKLLRPFIVLPIILIFILTSPLWMLYLAGDVIAKDIIDNKPAKNCGPQ